MTMLRPRSATANAMNWLIWLMRSTLSIDPGARPTSGDSGMYRITAAATSHAADTYTRWAADPSRSLIGLRRTTFAPHVQYHRHHPSGYGPDMKHIGIVACSAEGAALCYREICRQSIEVIGKHDHPRIT